MKILSVKGNTYCIDTGTAYVPFYKINENEIIMLDTGLRRQGKGIEEILNDNKLVVKGIINTHAHIDHIGNNEYFKEKYGATIAMPLCEAEICSSVNNFKMYLYNETLKFIKNNYSDIMCKTDIIINEYDRVVSICGVTFKILHTPGHSVSHIAIITPDNVAYVGDGLISYDLIEKFKIPYAYILGEDMKSKAELYYLNCSKYIVSHKGIYDNITKLIDENIDFYESRSMKIYELITKPMTFEEILKTAVEKFDISLGTSSKYNMTSRMLKPYIDYLCEIERLDISVEDGRFLYSHKK
ncbi:Glyoxylase, beta-lactamase superfamily II [Clostridium sp. DSM 8431]|uniref:MBL fold metallo-hydrolase n=1 Tax=Clostridium sp. DSM 8431 TaxID=1761781 RepID=UPI0008EC2EEA|nr:MBL fold metallo-hydrolase [Clostridium sp. DSM 8431]SFU81909.1 Glyoxylase, beta-lactamase superfamily II [Clostridium sp. DSM 8431]